MGDIAAAAAVASLMAGAVVGYHEWDNRPMVASLQNIEANSVVARLGRLYAFKCQGSTWPPELDMTIEQQERRYFELTGRDYTAPECPITNPL